jgi:hypothetical protein
VVVGSLLKASLDALFPRALRAGVEPLEEVEGGLGIGIPGRDP